MSPSHGTSASGPHKLHSRGQPRAWGLLYSSCGLSLRAGVEWRPWTPTMFVRGWGWGHGTMASTTGTASLCLCSFTPTPPWLFYLLTSAPPLSTPPWRERCRLAASQGQGVPTA
eukprot:scaffold144234_cov35-Tisochrysis_lutea.AAC.2